MKPLCVCTTVFNRYDLLRELVKSLAVSTRVPDLVYIIDHGYSTQKVRDAVGGILLPRTVNIVTLPDPGCAHSTNWIFDNVPDDKVLCGDDMTFHPEALEKLAAAEGDFITPKLNQNVFSCFLMRQRVFEAIGRFDEHISPGYLYYEDTDYQRRIDLHGGIVRNEVVDALVYHHQGGSQTMKQYNPAQTQEHHRRFRLATQNYVKKWGGMPFHETREIPYELKPKEEEVTA